MSRDYGHRGAQHCSVCFGLNIDSILPRALLRREQLHQNTGGILISCPNLHSGLNFRFWHFKGRQYYLILAKVSQK